MTNEYRYSSKADLQAFIDEHGAEALLSHPFIPEQCAPCSEAGKYLEELSLEQAKRTIHQLLRDGMKRAGIESIVGKEFPKVAKQAIAIVLDGADCATENGAQHQADAAVKASQGVKGTFPFGMLGHALDAVRRGYFVFPCVPGGKEPAGEVVPQGLLNASNDPEQIKRWWAINPNYNPAVNLEMSHKVVRDYDLVAPLLREDATTFTVKSGRINPPGRDGGYHCHYEGLTKTRPIFVEPLLPIREAEETDKRGAVRKVQYDALDRKVVKSRVAVGEIRSKGAYVVWNGALHKSGNHYSILNDAPILPWSEPDDAVKEQSNVVAVGTEEQESVASYVEAAFEKAGVDYISREQYQGGFRWKIDCPFAYNHESSTRLIQDGGSSAAVIMLPNGALSFKCQHAHCMEQKWADLRQYMEQEAGEKLQFADDKSIKLNQEPEPAEQARAAVLQEEREQQRQNERLQALLEYTDVQNAELFVQNNKDSVRANYGGSKGRTTWYWWDGARWKEDSEGKVVELAKRTAVEQAETVLEQLTEAFRSGDQEQQKAFAKRCKMARECCSDHRIHSMLNLAAAGTEISVVMTQLDGQPTLVNFKNGTLDLDTMELRPHRKEDLLTQLIPISYDPNAKCPKWEAFVERIFRDKPYMPKYLQRVVGYFLTGRNPEQVFFIFYGLPGGGKTTLRNVLKALIGEYAKTCPQGMFLMGYRRQSPDAPSPSHADLYGARLVLSEELDEDEKLDCRMVKMVSGGGEVKARPLYKPPFEYAPDYKLLFLTNHTPKISDFSGAIDDRLRVVKMEQRLRDTSEEVQDYHTVLMAELPGILAWAIRGLKEVKARGLQDPKEVRLMTQSFMQSENVVQEWLDERAEQSDGAFLTTTEAHRDFAWWAKQRGEDTKPMTPRWFGLRMSHLGWMSEPNSVSVRGYRGLKLRPHPSAVILNQVPSNQIREPVNFKRSTDEYDVVPERVH